MKTHEDIARATAEALVEIIDRPGGYQSMRLRGQSSLLWHSADRDLMELRRAEMVRVIESALVRFTERMIREEWESAGLPTKPMVVEEHHAAGLPDSG